MLTTNRSWKTFSGCAAALLLILTAGCSTQSESNKPAEVSYQVKRLPANAENAGFLHVYSKLKPSEEVKGLLTYKNPGAMKNLHRYVAIIFDPVEIYVQSDNDPSELPGAGAEAAASYFEYAVTSAISDAFPIVDQPGPLVLRLRTALVGVAIGGKPAEAPEAEGAKALPRKINIGAVRAEFELVDSVTGDVIAAAIDTKEFKSASIGATHFERMARFDEARTAFDQWAEGLRDFLDAAHELKGKDAERADQAYEPY